MRVLLIASYVGPAGIWPRGSVVDLPDDVATRALIAGGFAKAIAPPPEAAVTGAAETATIGPEETAARPRSRRPRRRGNAARHEVNDA
jgi:hypothetical protein